MNNEHIDIATYCSYNYSDIEWEVVLVYTPGGNKKRIISLRKANVQEQKAYQQQRLKAFGCNA